MKKLLNTLYVTTQGAYLARERECVVVRIDREDRLRLPIHTLDGIVCFGNVACSPFLMGLCGERGVTLSFLSEHGRFLARVQGPVSGNVLLRREQYRRADDPPRAADIARAIVAAKISNSRTVLLRARRDRPDVPGADDLRAAADQLAHILARLKQPQPLDTVRGLEGEAAHHYFAVFDHLISAQKQHFAFRGRNRRPPTDNVNALLSFLYSLLTHDAASACEAVGLDPQVGFLHADRSGRPSLALDLVEDLRAYLVDRLALSLINRRQVQPNGFQHTESGAVHMTDATRKAVLVAYQERKQEQIQHPFLKETAPLGLLVHLQAQLLARTLRGDLDAYPPFFWK